MAVESYRLLTDVRFNIQQLMPRGEFQGVIECEKDHFERVPLDFLAVASVEFEEDGEWVPGANQIVAVVLRCEEFEILNQRADFIGFARRDGEICVKVYKLAGER